MADFGQGDEVVSKPKSSWGHDDEVISTKQASVEGAGGAAFGVYPRPGMEPGKPTPTVSALGAFGASAAEGIAATPGVMAGARMGAAITPPITPYAKPVGAIAGGIVGGIAASKVIETTEQFADQIFGTNITGIRQQQQEQYPYTSLAGQVVGGAVNPLMRPGLPSSAVQGAVGSGIMTVVGATQRAIQGGDPFDPVAMTIDATTGAFTKPTKLGERLLGQAAAPIDMSAGKKPGVTSNVNPPPGMSKEEFIAGLEKKKQEKLSKVPLVETAIKDKATGEITRLGPKHPENVKEATKDTHEQGFVDEQGNFLNRKEAADRAVTAGQIETKTYTTKEISEPSKTVESINKELDVLKKRLASAEQTDAYDTAQQTRKSIKALEQLLKIVEQYGPTEAKYKDVTKTGPKIERPEEGLHSGDLRKAGDDRFKLADVPTEVNGVPIKEGSTGRARPDGRPIGASFNKETRTITIDTPTLYEQYGEKPWTKPKVEGVYPIAENAFPTFQDYVDFVVAHEVEHTVTPQAEGQTKAQYENQINQTALKQLAEKRATALKEAPTTIEPITWDTLKPGQQITLYRGEDKNVSGGEWWTTKKDIAEKFGNVTEVTLPSELVGKHAVQGHGGSHEFVFPTEGSRPTDLGLIKSTSDRTKTDPRDVKDEQEFNEIAQEIYEKHGEVEAVEFFRGWEEFKKTWAEPVKEVEKFVGTNINNKLANERIVHNNTADIKELAGKDVNLEQLTYDIDKGATLVGKAKEVADKFRSLMDELGKRALENNVIKGWHENYVARNIVTEGVAPPGALEEFMRDAFGYGEKASGDGTKTTTKYGQPRRLKSREDLVNHIQGINSWLESKGLDYRFKLKTDNLAEIYKDYALSVEKAIENKNLIDNIKQIRNVNGESLIKPISGPEDLPYGWKQIDHPDLAGYAIHPDLVPALKFVFDSGPGLTMQALGTISQAVKRINVIGSFFHAKSLMEVLSSSRIPLWTPVKEAIVLPLVEKGVKALTGKDLQLSAISKAVEQYKKGGLGDNVDLWIKSNMRLESPEDVSRGILSSTGKLADTLISKYGPKTRVLESSLSTVEKYTLGMFDKYTWDYLHTGGKIMVADAYLEKARLQAAKEGKPFDEMAARKEIASFVNDSFGGLNWFDAARRTEGEFAKRMAMAAYSPEGRRALQVALFAPDWTISTIRAFTSALPKGLNPTKWQPVEGIKGMMVPTTKADYARLYQFKTALVYFTLINAINNMTAGRDLWDNKDPTRIEFSDGTSMQAMKHAMEPYHWIADPDKTLSNKMGFIPKALIIGFGGVEYASPTAPKLVDLSGLGRLKAAVSTALPFQLQAGASAPEGEGAKRALLGTAGFPIYGADADTKKVQRAERELATKENAWKYRDNEIKKGRMQWTPKHDQEKRALDKRRQKLNKETE